MLQFISLNLSKMSFENSSKSDDMNSTSSKIFFKSIVRFYGYSNIYKYDSNILACYDRFRWVLATLMYFLRISPTRITWRTTSRFLDINDLNIALVAMKCETTFIIAYALLLLSFRKYLPLSPKYITNIDIDEYKYS